jgi:hypothetical protein
MTEKSLYPSSLNKVSYTLWRSFSERLAFSYPIFFFPFLDNKIFFVTDSSIKPLRRKKERERKLGSLLLSSTIQMSFLICCHPVGIIMNNWILMETAASLSQRKITVTWKWFQKFNQIRTATSRSYSRKISALFDCILYYSTSRLPMLRQGKLIMTRDRFRFRQNPILLLI